MNARRMLLVSNSTCPGEEYLGWVKNAIVDFLKDTKRILFVPYAGITFSYDAYVEKVGKALPQFQIDRVDGRGVDSLVRPEAIVVGGGNTWQLLTECARTGLLARIREWVNEGVPYVGWSAGANLACPTIRTTNDMPIVEVPDTRALNLVPFQINPHYLDANPAGHGGETRADRIREYIEVNREVNVVGLRERCLIEVIGGKATLRGERGARLFHYGEEERELGDGADLSSL